MLVYLGGYKPPLRQTKAPPNNESKNSEVLFMPDPLPIILLPGLGLDERLFATQKITFPEIHIPEWLTPGYFESLPDFARRMAKQVDPGRPCYLGGMSLGGMVALEMSRYLDCRGCFLISSIRSCDELPPWAKVLSPFAWILPPRCDLMGAAVGTAMLWTVARFYPRRWQQFCVHLSKLRAPMMPWACRAVLRWKPEEPFSCPIYQIHGDHDPILSRLPHHPHQVVSRGGHLLPLSHPFAITELFQQVITGV